MPKSRVALFMYAVCSALSGCGVEPTESPAIKSVDVRVESLAEFAEVERVVTLETTDQTAMGSVRKAALDPATGDVLVLDRNSLGAVLRFDAAGRFLARYTRTPGRGEPDTILDFAVLPDSSVVLATIDRLLTFASDGTPQGSRSVDFLPMHVTTLGGRVFVAVARHRPSPAAPWFVRLFSRSPARAAIMVYDDKLEPLFGFHDYDPRVDKWSHIPWCSLTVVRDTLYYSAVHDLKVTGYRPDGTVLARLTFPSANDGLEKLWEPARIVGAQREELGKKISRFERIDGFGDRLFLIEQAGEATTYLLLDPAAPVLYRFPGLKVLTRPDTAGSPVPTVDWIAGAYAQGLIGVVAKQETADVLRATFPSMRDATFTLTANPWLVFLKVRPVAPAAE